MDIDVKRTSQARTPEITIQRDTSPHIIVGTPSTPHSTPPGSRGATPERNSSPKHVKGTMAKFIRQNPRFVNTPICQMDPRAGGRSVADCLEWRQERSAQRHTGGTPQSPAHDSTVRRDYRPPSPDTRPQPLQRFSPQKPSNIPLGPAGRGREKISFVHQFDCRADTDQEPERGKLRGTFVWESLPPASSPSHKPSQPLNHR